jgi:hypothetical protein
MTPEQKAKLAEFNTPRKILRRWCRWPADQWKQLRNLAYLPRYLAADYREHYAPSGPSLWIGKRYGHTIEAFALPDLRISVMDGMGEHYGYPRHQLLLIIWWNRRAYAFGLSFAVPEIQNQQSPIDNRQ